MNFAITWRVALIVLPYALFGGACGPQRAQTVLTSVADVSLNATEESRVRFHERQDALCREEFPPAVSAYRDWYECMTPSYRLDTAVGALDNALRAAQHALDVTGEEGFRDMAPHLIGAASRLVGVMMEIGLEVPAEVRNVLEIAERFMHQ